MGIIRPATPGFLVTTAATILLFIVTLGGPIFKSIFFLKASIHVESISGNITFGTLGYCLELSNGTTCSKPAIGYQLDVNALVGNNLPIQIPQVAIKWLTYALVLHIVALILAAGSAIFGLLAHIREFSMTCFSTCISGFAAAVALLAFIFDIVFFFAGKARINSIPGGSASLGSALWLTLAAWLLLFFSGLFYTLGRCCIRNSGSRQRIPDYQPQRQQDEFLKEALKAENDRKARQQGGLPAFPERGKMEDVPLVGFVSDNEVSVTYPTGHATSGGYVPAPPGTLAVEGLQRERSLSNSGRSDTLNGSASFDQSSHQGNGYQSGSAVHLTSTPSQYRPAQQYASTTGAAQYSNQGYGYQGDTPAITLEPAPLASSQYPPQRGPSPGSVTAGPSYADQYSQDYGYAQQSGSSHYQSDPMNINLAPSQSYHPQRGTSYYSAVSAYSNPPAPSSVIDPSMPLINPHAHRGPPEREYTLGGNGYGDNIVPPLHDTTPYYPSASPPPLVPPSGPPSYSTHTQPNATNDKSFYSA